MVKTYRKKPVEIQALQIDFNYRNIQEIIDFVESENLCPIERRPDYILKIKIKRREKEAKPGDYIVKTSHGMLSICSPAVFEETYEIVE